MIIIRMIPQNILQTVHSTERTSESDDEASLDSLFVKTGILETIHHYSIFGAHQKFSSYKEFIEF